MRSILRLLVIVTASTMGSVFIQNSSTEAKLASLILGSILTAIFLFFLENEVIYEDRNRTDAKKILHEVSKDTHEVRIVEYNDMDEIVSDTRYKEDPIRISRFRRIIIVNDKPNSKV